MVEITITGETAVKYSSLKTGVLAEAKQHVYIAIDQLKPLPKTHEELIERMRDYFDGQKVEVFSKMLFIVGEDEFRVFITDTVVESGYYYRDSGGVIRPL